MKGKKEEEDDDNRPLNVKNNTNQFNEPEYEEEEEKR